MASVASLACASGRTRHDNLDGSPDTLQRRLGSCASGVTLMPAISVSTRIEDDANAIERATMEASFFVSRRVDMNSQSQCPSQFAEAQARSGANATMARNGAPQGPADCNTSRASRVILLAAWPRIRKAPRRTLRPRVAGWTHGRRSLLSSAVGFARSNDGNAKRAYPCTGCRTLSAAASLPTRTSLARGGTPTDHRRASAADTVTH